MAPYSAEDFQRDTGVSRETLDRLRAYAALLIKWQRKINLVSARTLDDIWRRHMLDSAQLLALSPSRPGTGPLSWLDLGSGAGFPGVVLAVMGAGTVHLVDSDARKCAFLREAARVTGARITVHCGRIESLEPWPADVISARACAPLPRLLELAEPFFGPDTIALFLKGQNIGFELTEASKCWKVRSKTIPSRSDPSGAILCIGGLSRG
ncbi:MAG: 16S rRNA (guanine(527)-N(7))-methyltransferase RsmG [Sphingomonadales bacterium]